MADIFISYKKEDAGRVVRIVEGLRAEGFTVWWDHGIAPGTSWDQEIQRELQAAKAVVAVWSDDSVHAPWVKEEANVGKMRGALVPVRIDDVAPPLGFGLIQFADLIDWGGDIEDDHWDFFIESVRAVMSGEVISGLEKPAAKRRLPFLPIAAVLGLLVLAGGAFVGYQALSSVGSVSYDRVSSDGQATTTTVSRTATRASEAEEAMFLAAQETRLKTDYQDFLRSFPQGYYAQRVREEILPLCAGENRPGWRPFKTDNEIRGVSTLEDPRGDRIIYTQEAEACASAKRNVDIDAKRFCNLVAGANSSRNIEISIADADCECTVIEADNSVWCLVDSIYACSYEMAVDEYVEVCG
ncbi:MAG: toll/interleukin-1 receptor domain-containing protein [Pseudomonadota bacterium]